MERLYFLGQYTTGKAREVIKGCLQRRSNDAYDEAKDLLQRQFGDPFSIASARITKLSTWPQIKPNEGGVLRNFAITLEQAQSAMKGMSHMQDLNTAQVLQGSATNLVLTTMHGSESVSMFFQVRVKEKDQSLLRFLWWPDGNMEQKAEEYCMTVHLFGAGSSPACANFALRRTADDHESEYGITVADTL